MEVCLQSVSATKLVLDIKQEEVTFASYKLGPHYEFSRNLLPGGIPGAPGTGGSPGWAIGGI